MKRLSNRLGLICLALSSWFACRANELLVDDVEDDVCRGCNGTTAPGAEVGQRVWFGAIGMCPDCCPSEPTRTAR